MITQIIPLNIYPVQKRNKAQNAKFRTLGQDVFERQIVKSPSFTSKKIYNLFPRNEIIKHANDSLAEIKNASGCNDLEQISKNFFAKNLLEDLLKHKKEFGENDQNLFSVFRHEMINLFGAKINLIGSSDDAKMFIKVLYPEVKTEGETFSMQKKILTEIIFSVKECVKKWSVFEKNNWLDENTVVPVGGVVRSLKSLINSHDRVKVSGLELLKGKQVKDPMALYTVCSHPLLNAKKYGENKPFEISIQKTIEGNKEKYWATFLNPETKAIPDDEIDRILLGSGYRAKGTNNIVGSGLGFKNIVEKLEEKGYSEAIPNLIEKGRDKGVCIKIPLLGVE